MASEASIEHGAGGRGMNWSEQHPATVPLIRISSHGKKNDVKVSTPTARQESLRGSSPGAARRDMRVDTPFAADHGKDDINWITRVQNRTDELRKLFSLPVTENVLEDFHCALQKTILLQGRMYVFEHYVCFSSNLFGYSKIKTIPLKDVTSVRKRKNYGFPNTIEIIWRGKKEFFTSFLSRDDAYRLIIMAWHQSSGYAKLFGAPVGEAGNTLRTSHRFRNRLRGSLSPQPSATETTVGQSQVSSSGPSATPQLRRIPDEEGSYSSDASVPPSIQGDDEGDTLELGGEAADSESEGETHDPHVVGEWELEDGPAPKVPPEMSAVASAQLNISVRDFFQRLLSDQSNFFLLFHEKRNDKKIQLSHWRQHPNMGRVRELQFISQIKTRMGPPQAHCLQIQRYRVFKEDHLVFETTQVMNDIPFGDHFSVETRWDIVPAPPDPSGAPQCQVQTHVAIPFSKGTLWKKAIEKGTLDSCKESHNDWLALAGKSLQPSPSLNGKKSGVSLPQGQPANSRRSQDGPNVTEVLQKAEPQFHADMTRVLGRASEPVPRRVETYNTENQRSGWRKYLQALSALYDLLEQALASQPLLTLSITIILLLQSELAVLQQRMEVLQADIGTALRELQALSRMNPNVSGDANTS